MRQIERVAVHTFRGEYSMSTLDPDVQNVLADLTVEEIHATRERMVQRAETSSAARRIVAQIDVHLENITRG